MGYDTGFLIRLYRQLLLIRQFEERVKYLFLEGVMPGTIHQYQGQEAVAVGVCAALGVDGVLLGPQAADPFSRRVLRCSMELGGNAPLIVYDDADLDVAVEGAFVAKMRNGGASCIAANRVFLQRGIADRFTEELTRRMAAVSVGPPLDEGAELGPLVSAREQRRVANLVEAAVGDGAEASTGGSPPERPGFFYPPTVLTQVDFEAPILAEEIFGPVAPLVVFDTEEEVLERANATEFGLAGYVFSSNLERALRTAEALEIGIIGINRGYVSDPAAPFGGYKGSGLGREGGREGIEEFLETKYIAVDW